MWRVVALVWRLRGVRFIVVDGRIVVIVGCHDDDGVDGIFCPS